MGTNFGTPENGL